MDERYGIINARVATVSMLSEIEAQKLGDDTVQEHLHRIHNSAKFISQLILQYRQADHTQGTLLVSKVS